MAELQLQAVSKIYPGKVRAVREADFTAADGEFIVIVGPSGCGKSTLIRMVAGLETVTSGTIRIGERVVNEVEPAQRDIAMVFQNYALYPHMNVYRNMAYGLKNRGMPRAEIERRVREVARILELEALLDRAPRQLSGGQRQRVAMGRAIVRNPQVFLFDEPLSNLDAKLRVQMRVEIRRLQQRFRTTSLYVTHDQVEAMTLADRLVVMNAGNVEQIGRPLELYHRPQTTFVAGFIGSPSMNLLDARVGADGRTLALAGGDRLAIDEPGAEPGRALTLGIRPEHFEPAVDADGHLHLRVDLVEELGADTLVHGHFGSDNGSDAAGTPLTARLPGIHPVTVDAILPLTVASRHLHLFDRDSGRRLDR